MNSMALMQMSEVQLRSQLYGLAPKRLVMYKCKKKNISEINLQDCIGDN